MRSFSTAACAGRTATAQPAQPAGSRTEGKIGIAADAFCAATPACPIPSLATALLGTYGPVLVIAPRSQEWPCTAPANVSFLSPGVAREEIIDRLRQDKPLALVVGDQPIDAELIAAWRAACPHEKLVLLRRGSSIDKFDLDACRYAAVEVVNTPGVNAPYVAQYAMRQLQDEHGRTPGDVRVLGLGLVGQELARQLCAHNGKARVTAAVRSSRPASELGLEAIEDQLRMVQDWDALFDGASSMAICVSTNDSTIGRVRGHHIAALARGARVVCVAKPDVFSDDALLALAGRPDIALIVDYGAATLEAFRRRLAALGIPPAAWARPPVLTMEAATAPACKRDLDHAVGVALATRAIDRFVAETMARPMRLPTQAPDAGAPLASVVGCGINGLLHAFVLRCLGWRVDVYGERSPVDGASHKNINMRHLSATETTARPANSAQLHKLDNELVIRFNQGGIELFGKLLADNPRFRPFAAQALVRAFPEGVPQIAGDVAFHSALAGRDMPSGKKGGGGRMLAQAEFQDRFAVPGVAAAVEVPGYDLAFRDFMAEMTDALGAAGVNFVRTRLSPAEVRALGEEGGPVITAMGVADEGITPIVGWFFRMRAAGGEGGGFRGLKLQYPLPVGVMNSRCDGEWILVSGGQVPHGASTEQAEAIKDAVMQAVARHFPESFAQAQADGSLEVVTCARPGVPDGLSRIVQTGPHHTMVGGTYAGGTTQGALLAALSADRLRARPDGDGDPITSTTQGQQP